MKELVLATNNIHKKEEIEQILSYYKILTLKDINFNDEIIEDRDTFEGNSLKKAEIIFNYCGKPTIADDSGLIIDLLNGEPGVYSARYSKEGTDEKNIEKVLCKLEGKTSSARFVSVISYVDSNGSKTFRGEVEGLIISECRGINGFGYDPIFYVENLNKTFAELNSDEKNNISHRKQALNKFVKFLSEEK